MKNKFVRSCQENSKEVQEALFALGYKWANRESGQLAYLSFNLVFTRKDGSLGAGRENLNEVPCLYDFTEETKLVATLKPVNNRLTGLSELTELRDQAEALIAKIKEMEAKQCEA